jgi:polyferredoxin
VGKITVLLLLLIVSTAAVAIDRVPAPEFESDYVIPELQVPNPVPTWREFFDVGVLAAALGLSVFFAIKARRRTGIAWLAVFSVAYFGFLRKGCVCPVGSTQNVALALFNQSYVIPVSVVLIFLLPVVFTMLFGRTFCSSVCPLGAIQELLIFKPQKVPKWIAAPLSFLPVLYLGFAVLFAATGSDFIICRFDPFVSIYRIGGGFGNLLLGGVFLVTAVFVARPYCRFFCPYGLILSWISRLSRRHVTITPDECVHCTLCEQACPVDAIRTPVTADSQDEKAGNRKRMLRILAAAPLLIAVGGLAGYGLHDVLARMHPTVVTAERYSLEESGLAEGMTLRSETLRASTKDPAELKEEAEKIISRYKTGSILLGLFVALLFCIRLAGLSRRTVHDDYIPDRGECVSCARCFTYCPREHAFRARRNKEPAELPG